MSGNTGWIKGGMAERLKAAVLKTVRRESVSWVRIPVPPPYSPVLVDNLGNRYWSQFYSCRLEWNTACLRYPSATATNSLKTCYLE